jgi:hypothetical protein
LIDLHSYEYVSSSALDFYAKKPTEKGCLQKHGDKRMAAAAGEDLFLLTKKAFPETNKLIWKFVYVCKLFAAKIFAKLFVSCISIHFQCSNIH